MLLNARSDGERGQSMTEYALILAVVAVAAVAVLGMVSPAISGEMASLTTALGGEDEKSPFRVLVTLPSWVIIGVLSVAAVGIYVLRMGRD
jgi:Flp pilus assembly pilin Flp